MLRRVLSSSTPSGSYPEPSDAQCASGLTITGATRNTVSLSWTAGSTGTRVVILASTVAVTANPIDFTSNYAANASYTLATDLNGVTGTLPRVVYDGNATAMTVSGLAANTIYYFKLVSFKANANNDFNTRNYNTINVLSTYTRTSR